MEQDTNITDVVFRCDKHGDFKDTVFALLPHEVDDRNGHVTSYQHVGQHSSADYTGCIASSRPATPEEYKNLKAEMEGRGYNLNIVQKQNRNKFVASWDSARKMLGS
jgi:hypothetical protein